MLPAFLALGAVLGVVGVALNASILRMAAFCAWSHARVPYLYPAVVGAATGAIFLIYLASIVLGFFHINIPFIHESGMIGIGFSLFVVVIAALNLVLDFDFIESGVEAGAPKYMEWYGAFGLMVTLVWLYVEFLRLLAKLQSRD